MFEFVLKDYLSKTDEEVIGKPPTYHKLMIYAATADGAHRSLHTTKMSSKSFAVVQRRVYFSFLYRRLGLLVRTSSLTALPGYLSSMKTSRINEFITPGPIGVNVLDQRTTPEVVSISKVSSMLNL